MSRPPVLPLPADRALFRTLWQFLRPHRGVLGWGLLCLAVVFAMDLLGPYLIRRIIDGPLSALATTAERVPEEAPRPLWQTLGGCALLYLGASLVGALFRYLQLLYLTETGQRVIRDVRQRLFGHLLRLPQAFFDKRPVGELVTRLTSDVENLGELFTSGLATMLFDLFRIVVLLGILLWIHPGLALVVLAGVPLHAWVAFRFRDRARVAHRDARAELAKANSFLMEGITGLRAVQLAVQESRMAGRFAERGERLRAAWAGTIRQYATFLPLMDLINQAVVIVTFAISVVLIGDGDLTAGVYFQYWWYLRLIFDPISQIAERYNVLQSALSSTERIHGLLHEPAESATGQAGALQGRLQFDRVSFAYGKGAQALHRVSLEVQAGETVAVVGATGAGKSTLAQLLLGLYHPQDGQVLVDGRPLPEWMLPDLRRQVAVVPQDVFLFADTVLENVRLRDPSIPAATVHEACQAVGADHFIERLPDRYDSRVGERGIHLSAGQRQLLAFARVLPEDPRVLILDEATSSVDSETEYLLQQAVRTMTAGRTCVIIAHRLSTLREADRIFVLHHGQLRESGTHDELLAQEGIYARLHQLQFRDENGPSGAVNA